MGAEEGGSSAWVLAQWKMQMLRLFVCCCLFVAWDRHKKSSFISIM